MRRLVIHLGLPKTATTSLQTHIFPQLPGYLGNSNRRELMSNAQRKVWELMRGGSLIDKREVNESDRRPMWVASLESWVEELVASEEDIILWSEEELMAWCSPTRNAAPWPVMNASGALPRRGSHPIVGYLTQLHELLPQTIELKTILTLRNQSDWLISLAAQLGIANTEFVERLIRDDDAFLDYHAMTKDLERLRGSENHLTLFYENRLQQNVQEILQFASYSPANFLSLEVLEERKNVRTHEAGWKVEQFSPLQKLERSLRRLRDKWPLLDEHLSSNWAFRRTFRPFLGSEARQWALGWISPFGKQANISLTEKQRNAIKSHCETSNERLGARLDVNLKALGY